MDFTVPTPYYASYGEQQQQQQTEQEVFNPSEESVAANISQQQQQQGSKQRHNPLACLFIVSVSPHTTEEKLRKHFESNYGPITRVSIKTTGNNSRPHAFVQFLNVADADRALNNTQVVDSHALRMSRAKVNTTLFVAKVSRSMRNPELRQIAETFGEVEHVNLLMDSVTNSSKGYGFIRYKYREDAKDARDGLKAKHPEWTVDWSTNPKESDRNAEATVEKTALYIGGLDNQITEEMVRRRFEVYGELKSINFMKPKEAVDPITGAEKNPFAFVRYYDESAAARAIEAENNQEWAGRRLRVEHPDTPTERQAKKSRAAASASSTTSVSSSSVVPHHDLVHHYAFPYPSPSTPYGILPPSFTSPHGTVVPAPPPLAPGMPPAFYFPPFALPTAPTTNPELPNNPGTSPIPVPTPGVIPASSSSAGTPSGYPYYVPYYPYPFPYHVPVVPGSNSSTSPDGVKSGHVTSPVPPPSPVMPVPDMSYDYFAWRHSTAYPPTSVPVPTVGEKRKADGSFREHDYSKKPRTL